MAENHNSAVNVADQDRARGSTLAAEEEHVLRCLGAAIIMQWNALPKAMQRNIFDAAASVGEVWETEGLRGQIARFLHKRKNVAARDQASTEDARRDAKSRAAALSRWDDERRRSSRRTAEVNQRRQQEDPHVYQGTYKFRHR